MAVGQDDAVAAVGFDDAVAELLLIEPGVQPAPCQQLVVGPALDDRAGVDGEDDVGVADGRQPVRDGDRGPPLDERFERLLDDALALV